MTSKPVLVARIAGGLGNQMFIYAAARRLAHVSGAELALDMSNGFSRDGYGRFYQLDWFALNARRARPLECLQPFNRLRRKISTRLHKNTPFSNSPFIKQKGVAYEPELIDTRIRQRVYFEGYWQGEGYFADIAEIIRDDFAFVKPMGQKNEETGKKIESVNAVGVHVRFFSEPGAEKSDNSTISYYTKACAEIEERVNAPHYFIFSDRPQAACDMLNLPPGRFTLVDQNASDEMAPCDMWLMSQCRHFIIANSTFSWWGAWLGNAADKIVCAPAIAPSPFRKYDSWGFPELLPSAWVQIES